nr:MFS transporter [Deinobacterium chartae]
MFAAQALATGATTISVSLSSILAAQLSGQEALAGLPSTLNMLASAASAYGASRVMAARGRRVGLTAAYLLGALGAGVAGLSAIMGVFWLFLLGGALVGVAAGAIQQGRYAAAELVAPAVRGRVMGYLLSFAVVGAFASAAFSPALTRLGARLEVGAVELGWLLGAVFLALGGALIALLMPARTLEAGISETASVRARSLRAIFMQPAALTALLALGIGQGVMVMLMVLMPKHAEHLGHGLPTISGLITAHVVGMYGLAWAVGGLVDRFGERRALACGALLLLVSALTAVPATGAAPMGLSLYLLGLGWNFCFVSGSSLLVRAVMPEDRLRAQGAADVVVWSCAAAGALGGGVLMATAGFVAVAALGGIASLGALVAAATLRQPDRA